MKLKQDSASVQHPFEKGQAVRKNDGRKRYGVRAGMSCIRNPLQPYYTACMASGWKSSMPMENRHPAWLSAGNAGQQSVASIPRQQGRRWSFKMLPKPRVLEYLRTFAPFANDDVIWIASSSGRAVLLI
jgi:hypothetical protein